MGMAKQPHVPKFGDWGSEEKVPYTAYFNNARKGRNGGKLINPNDPQENPDAIFDNKAPQAASDSDAPLPGQPAASRPKHERRTSREEGQFKRATESPVGHDAGSHKGFTDSPHDRGVNSGDSHRKGGRISGGSDRSTEQSPLHPHHQTRSGGKGGVSSPLWERKGLNEGSHGLGPSTPGRSRLRSVEPPEKETAVPKFGDWDESNPSSADGFTHIFNKVREEKQIGAAKVPVIQTESSYSYGYTQNNADLESTWCCCFSRSKN